MIVWAFDGTRQSVIGEIDLPVQIRPHTCQVTFQVMDINLAYSCLLGRPWIHSIGVVPSTLHQKLKFMVEGRLVIVSGEEDILVSFPSSMSYIEATEEFSETNFQSFKVVSNAFVESLPMRPCMSDAVMMVARVMLGHEYKPGMGLGKNKDGMASLVEFKETRGRFGLGYRPTRADVRRSALEMRSRGMGQQQRPRVKKAHPCHISKSFVSTGWRCEEQVPTIHDEAPQDHSNWVQPCLPDFQLGNWQVVERPEVSKAGIM